MGVVKRQSIKRSIVNYLGVAVGMVSTIFIYPLDFDTAGLAQFVVALAALFVPFASFGINRLTIRFFPEFKSQNRRHHNFLMILLTGITIVFVLFTGLLFLFEDNFIRILQMIDMNPEVLIDNKGVVLIICLFMAYNFVLADMASNFNRVVIPIIWNNLLFKLTVPLFVLGVYFNYIGLDTFRAAIAGSYVLAFFGLVLYLTRLGQFHLSWDFSFVSKNLMKRMGEYAVYGALSTLGYLIAFRIDSIMIGSMVDTGAVAEYNFFSTMVKVMAIPFTALVAIAAPIISSSYAKGDVDEIHSLYKRSSETMLVAGGLLLVGTWLCLDDLIALTGKSDVLTIIKPVYLILAAGNLINMVTGFNEQIIAYSKYFRFNLIAMLVLACFNIYLNITLIPLYGLVGAAIATAVSFTIYNVVKLVFIYIKLRMFPFTGRQVIVLALIFLVIYLVSLVPTDFHPVFNILILGSLSVILYMGPILLLRLSPEVNDLVKQGMDRVRDFIR